MSLPHFTVNEKSSAKDTVQSIYHIHKKPPILTKCCLHEAAKAELSIEPLPLYMSLPGGSDDKESAHFVGDLGLIFPPGEDPLEESMATHSSILSWRIPWTEEPGRLQSKGVQRVGHN